MKINWGPQSHGAELRINNPSGLDKYRYFYIDCETDEKENGDHIISIALCPSEEIVYWFSWPNKEYESVIKKTVESSWLAGQNIKGDLHWLRNHGFKVNPDRVVFDTQLAAYVICSTKKSLALKDLVKEVLEWHYPTYKGIVRGKDFINYACEKNPNLLIPSKAKRKEGKIPRMLHPHKLLLKYHPIEVQSNYNGMDSLSGEVLGQVYKGVMTGNQKQYLETIELPVMKVCYDTEARGIKVDLNKLYKFHKEWEDKRNRAEERLYNLAGKKFNPRSNPDKLKILRKLIDPKIPSTGKEVLSKYPPHPFVTALHEFGGYQKLTSTYSGPMILKALQDPNHRIHTNFNQVAYDEQSKEEKGIRTGRFSSSDPNLQNIHSRNKDEDGKDEVHPLRTVFIPEKGFSFIGADYNQLEYRLLAHFSTDPTLLDAYTKGLDIHTVTAAKAFGVSIDKVTPDLRKRAKAINFGIIYGQQARALSESLGISLYEAQQFMEDYKKQFPDVENWKQNLLDQAHREGGVWTLFGRFIPLPDLRSINEYTVEAAERQVTDYRIQGTAADINKKAMIRLWKNHKARLVLAVHDELLLEEENTVARQMAGALEYEMSNVVKLRLPLPVKAVIGQSWAECK